ncbi:MAG: DUF3060 domain-containing protein [Myxococcales bacterium]|nr:DUF3060 domain-containing protein [Myxococcales bacterium]
MRTMSLMSVVVLGLSTASTALAAPLIVRGDRGNQILHCNPGQQVQVTGSNHHLSINGDCGELNIRGSGSKIEINGLASVVVVGSDNDVAWVRNLSGKPKLPVRATGTDNKVHQVAGERVEDGAPAGGDHSTPSADAGSTPDALVVRGTGSRKTLTCEAGQPVRIEGSTHHITLQGDCGKLHVEGSNIEVTADGVSAIHVEGSMNTIHWQRNLSGQASLPVSREGTMLKVTGP